MSPNKVTIDLSDGRRVLLSYGTPVAAWVPGRGYVKRNRNFSPTTSRHVNDFVANGHRPIVALDETEFATIVDPISLGRS